MAIIGVRCTKRPAVVKDDRTWRHTDQVQNYFSKFQGGGGGGGSRLKRTKNMSLTLLLPPGMKKRLFRTRESPAGAADNATRGHHHVEPSVWTPSCAIQALGGAS